MPQQPSKAAQTDNSGWTPVDESAAPPSGWTAVDEGEKPGFLKRLGQSVGVPTSGDELKDALSPVTIGGVPVAPKQSGLGAVVGYGKNLYEKGRELVAHPDAISALRAAMATTPAGSTEQTVAEDAASGNYRGAAGGATGIGLQMAAPELAERIPAGKISRSMAAIAGPAAEAAAKLPVVDKVVGAARALGKYKGVAGELSDIWGKEPVYPGASEPATPDPALLKARSLFEGSSSPPDPAAGLGTIKQSGQAGQLAASMQKPPSTEVAPGFQRGALGNLLDRSLGAKKLDPKVSLRNQMDVATPTTPRAAAPAASSADLAEGHTPVQSTALKSYKYDPVAQEFHAKYGSSDNTVHVFGDVTPEEAQAFEEAKSKGQAMQRIKSSGTLVAKIINGKRVAVKAAAK